MRFFDWDHRPAVLVDGKAFAVLRPGAAWVSVDEFDVRNTSADLDEAAWRKRFVGEFGRLDVLRWRPARTILRNLNLSRPRRISTTPRGPCTPPGCNAGPWKRSSRQRRRSAMIIPAAPLPPATAG
jgi:hypothetical protein